MRELIADQPKAYEAILIFLKMSGGGMFLLQGKAGTGKSALMGEVVNYINTTRITRVAITAPTHKAVKVLKQFIDPENSFFTIHAVLGMKEFIDDDGNLSFRKDPMIQSKADNYRLLIVDEASMIDDNIFIELERLVNESNMKVLFVGDEMQIPPVNHLYAKPFEKETQLRCNIKVTTMETIIRQAEGNPIIENASRIRDNILKPHQIINPQEVKNSLGGVFPIKKDEQLPFFVSNILPLYKSKEYEDNIDFIKVIAWRNETVDFYNKIIREYIFETENLPKIIIGDKLIADAPVVDNNKVLISTNEEMIVLDLDIAEEHLGDNFILTYYKTLVRVYNGGLFNEYWLKIIHEDSEKTYNKILTLQKQIAKGYPKGSFNAKSAWIDYYKFIESWHKIKYAPCITAHKSQGSTYINTYVLMWDIMKNYKVFERNRIFYTACTRPSKNLYIVQ